MSGPSTRDLQRQVIQLVHAATDMRCAAALADKLLDGPADDFSAWAWGLLTGMVVSYARPFTTSQTYGNFPAKWSKFKGKPFFKRHHDRLIEYRHGLLAHTDLSPHREVVVFPSGGPLRVPFVTERRFPVGLNGIQEIRNLFGFQEERFSAEALELVKRSKHLRDGRPKRRFTYNSTTFRHLMGTNVAGS
jgi:hypothetical protein